MGVPRFLTQRPRNLWATIQWLIPKAKTTGPKIASVRPSGTRGGIETEGEEITTLELTLETALAMMDRGEIVDAKTILLLQYAALHLFTPLAR